MYLDLSYSIWINCFELLQELCVVVVPKILVCSEFERVEERGAEVVISTMLLVLRSSRASSGWTYTACGGRFATFSWTTGHTLQVRLFRGAGLALDVDHSNCHGCLKRTIETHLQKKIVVLYRPELRMPRLVAIGKKVVRPAEDISVILLLCDSQFEILGVQNQMISVTCGLKHQVTSNMCRLFVCRTSLLPLSTTTTPCGSTVEPSSLRTEVRFVQFL